MSTNERNEHFQGFANLLYQELSELEGSHETIISEYRNKYDKQEIVRLIAQYAYDLVYFLLDKAPYHSGSFDVGYGSSDEIHEAIEHLPDLTAWPTAESS